MAKNSEAGTKVTEVKAPPKKTAAEYAEAIKKAREEVKANQKASAKVLADFRKIQNTLRKSLGGIEQNDRFKQLGANYTGLVTEAGSTQAFLEHSEKFLRELLVIEQL